MTLSLRKMSKIRVLYSHLINLPYYWYFEVTTNDILHSFIGFTGLHTIFVIVSFK